MMNWLKKHFRNEINIFKWLFIASILAFWFWNHYQQNLILIDLRDELHQINEREVSRIILKEGTTPYHPGKCLTITDRKEIQIIVGSLKKISDVYWDSQKEPMHLKFQLVILLKNDQTIDVLGTVYKPFPDRVSLERNLYTQINDDTYSMGGPQKSLDWPNIGSLLKDKLREADRKCTMEIPKEKN